MRKYKIIKRFVEKYAVEEVEEKVPMWYFRFLVWLFKDEESKLDAIVSAEKMEGWYTGYKNAQETAHSSKEEAMQQKLHELGYEVVCNFPIAIKIGTPTSPAIDPKTSWMIVPIK